MSGSGFNLKIKMNSANKIIKDHRIRRGWNSYRISKKYS